MFTTASLVQMLVYAAVAVVPAVVVHLVHRRNGTPAASPAGTPPAVLPDLSALPDIGKFDPTKAPYQVPTNLLPKHPFLSHAIAVGADSLEAYFASKWQDTLGGLVSAPAQKPAA